jgi:energy-coupling factor transporter ATP-binding protein EcfA2
MLDETKICPYTGLRPFTEEESIYFKGRDEHIDQATRQLEKNKFIMLTGASGDGKSSLVYAGIIPNAKAGFLKASFSNWSVVDFRPERNPLENLSRALASQLAVKTETVQTELNYGFSALIDMYKASPLYFDARSAEWLNASEKEKNEKRRKASNLIILADQFEEFFTNPENFQKGVPSQEAMSVTNLLLETARIALEENLPIYVIITMRSDYIGQCAAFRGLPEYIGFSQFFVPRLNRKELREVIEEPAVLSGNQISRRLTERLIHDMVEGTDQLPILQHALNQIWKMADSGHQEMDLIHYAMVGGIQGKELSENDAVTFRTWFASLPEKVQSCYHQPSLQNVLNTHANKLYNQASDYLRGNNKGQVSEADAKMIIEIAFKCLTKIDNSRAVRNRMTLEEITAIINIPHLDFRAVGNTLDIFREPGNTLLRPFSEEVPELKEYDVLDITHESLIRNWENLGQWAKEEFDSHTISLDFGQQLNRWMKSNKSGDFLLSIGPLTYFESWINRVKPNAAWVARYLKDDLEKGQKLEKAERIQQNASEFIRRSARKHFVTRTVLRYGPGRIAAVLGALIILTLSSFAVRNYLNRQNTTVLKDLSNTTVELMATPGVILRNKTNLACEQLMLGDLTIVQMLQGIDDPIESANLAIAIAGNLVERGQGHPKGEIMTAFAVADSLLDGFALSEKNPERISRMLKRVTDMRDVLELAYFYIPTADVDAFRKKNASRSAEWTLAVLKNQPAGFNDARNLNLLLEHAINNRTLSDEQLKEIITILSPFDNSQSSWVKEVYNRDIVNEKGFFRHGFKFNGLYQELAYLYASTGNTHSAIRAIDTLLLYNQNYLQNDYGSVADNASHIAACFYRYDHGDQLDEFVDLYCRRKKISLEEFYARLLGRCKLYEFSTTALHYDVRFDQDYNLSLEYADNALLEFFFNKYRESVKSTLIDPNARNFKLALSYKDEGIIRQRKLEVAGLDSLNEANFKYFDRAIELYRSVDRRYLDEEIEMVELSVNDNMVQARKFLFLYPDIRTQFHPNEPRLFHYFFVSGSFLEYILKRNLFDELYKTGAELKYFELFFRDYHFVETDVAYTASKRISYETFSALEKNLERVGASRYANLEFLYLGLGHEASLKGEKEKCIYYYSRLNTDKLKTLFVNSFNPNFALRYISFAVADLVKYDNPALAEKLVRIFESAINRSSVYAYAASSLLWEGINDSRVSMLIDSSKQQILKVSNLSTVQPNRLNLANALAMRNASGDLEEAYQTLKNVELKLEGIAWLCRSLAARGNLYQATQNIPDNISATDIKTFAWNIMVGYEEGIRIDIQKPEWNQFAKNRLYEIYRPIIYTNENN